MSTVKELRQAGRFDEAHALAKQSLEADPDNIWNKRAMGWVIYEYLKLNATYETRESFQSYVRQLLSLGFDEDENMLLNNSTWQIVKSLYDTTKQTSLDLVYLETLISYCKQIPYACPSDQHSAVLKAVSRVQEKYPNFLSFIDWWDLNNLQQTDFQKETVNDREIMPLAEQAHIAIAKKLLTGQSDPESQDPFNSFRIIDKRAIELFIPKLDELIKTHPEYLYPPYFKAKLLIQIGDKENVLKSFLPFAKKKNREFWMWQVLAETFSDDIQKQIACYCRALTCRSPDGFLVKIREEFAKILVAQKLHKEAKTEILNIIQTREKEGWRVPSNVSRWMKEPWYESASSSHNNRDFYKMYLTVADEILFSDIEPVIGVVEYVNAEREVAYFIVNKSISGNFKFDKQEILPSSGDFFELKLIKAKGKDGDYFRVISFNRTSTIPSSETLVEFNGQLRVMKDKKGSYFGFVDDIFIPPDLLRAIEIEPSENRTLNGIAIISFNKGKETWGWKAVAIH